MFTDSAKTWGYLMPRREPERRLTRLSDALGNLLNKLTVTEQPTEPTPPAAAEQPTDTTPPADADPLPIEPELGRIAIGSHRAAEFRIWCILRQLTREGDGSGKVHKKALKAALARFGVSYTPQHLNALLRAGDRLFWNLSKRHLFLRSRQYVAVELAKRHPDLLETNLPGVREMYVSAAGSLEQWEAMIYAAWMAHRENPTISRERLEKLFNRSQDTLRRWERDRLQHSITIRANYAQLHDPAAISFTPPEDSFTYQAEVRTSTGSQLVERLSWRLPNTYLPTGIRQHPRRGQARKTRAATKDQLANPAEVRHGGRRLAKRYFDDAKALRNYVKKHDTIGYVWRGETPSKVGIFEPSENGYTHTRAGERRIMNCGRRRK